MAKSTIQHRRQVRALEAKRDKLVEDAAKRKTELAKVRTELKLLRATGAK